MSGVTPVEAAGDSLRAMCAFLHMDQNQKFTEADRESVRHDVGRLAQCVDQMDAGQRGRGVSFDEIPHIMVRLSVACMHMVMSGALDRLEVDEWIQG